MVKFQNIQCFPQVQDIFFSLGRRGGGGGTFLLHWEAWWLGGEKLGGPWHQSDCLKFLPSSPYLVSPSGVYFFFILLSELEPRWDFWLWNLLGQGPKSLQWAVARPGVGELGVGSVWSILNLDLVGWGTCHLFMYFGYIRHMPIVEVLLMYTRLAAPYGKLYVHFMLFIHFKKYT